MNKTLLILATLLFSVTFNAGTASAHAPVYVGTQSNITVPDAETSRAYYGELGGSPAVYTITSDKEFELYLNILSPYIPDARTDFVVTITTSTGAPIALLNNTQSVWEKWYEDFGGDTYYKGPEFKQTVPAGTYIVTVSNTGNTGKYVLAPGEAEVFTLGGTPQTIHQVYLEKTLLFDKPWYSIFEGIIGKTLLSLAVLLIAVISFIAYRVRKRMRKI
jgi:hypothetical protein